MASWATCRKKVRESVGVLRRPILRSNSSLPVPRFRGCDVVWEGVEDELPQFGVGGCLGCKFGQSLRKEGTRQSLSDHASNLDPKGEKKASYHNRQLVEWAFSLSQGRQ